MRVAVHDFSGHPFQVQLSRHLARRGYQVAHFYCASLSGGQGNLEESPDDPPTLRVIPVIAPRRIDKSQRVRRLYDETIYGRTLRMMIEAFEPHVLLSSNAPTHVQAVIQGVRETARYPTVLWLQDLYGEAIRAVYSRRSRVAGTVIAAPFAIADRHLATTANHVVVISDSFIEALGAKLGTENVTVIPNWSPLEEIPVLDKANRWSFDNGLNDTTNLVYSGTLGMKHNPELLMALADRSTRFGAQVVVVGSGTGMLWLEDKQKSDPRENLHLFQPVAYSQLPQVLGTADITISLLEADAGRFSVPSKVLTYLAAGRPILGAMPAENLASETIVTADAGFVSQPGDANALVNNAVELLADFELRSRLGANARQYAERTFDIDRITDRFESILKRVSPSV